MLVQFFVCGLYISYKPLVWLRASLDSLPLSYRIECGNPKEGGFQGISHLKIDHFFSQTERSLTSISKRKTLFFSQTKMSRKDVWFFWSKNRPKFNSEFTPENMIVGEDFFLSFWVPGKFSGQTRSMLNFQRVYISTKIPGTCNSQTPIPILLPYHSHKNPLNYGNDMRGGHGKGVPRAWGSLEKFSRKSL